MNGIMKNIEKAKALVLKDEIAYQEGQVVSKTLAQNSHVSITLFSFDKGEEISTHAAGGDAFVTCLDGIGEVTIGIGSFINAIINFLIVAFVLFSTIKAINLLHKKPEEAPKEPTTKVCPYCQSEIAIKAVRCPHCTTKLEGFPEIND